MIGTGWKHCPTASIRPGSPLRRARSDALYRILSVPTPSLFGWKHPFHQLPLRLRLLTTPIRSLTSRIDAFRSAQPKPRRTRATSSAATEQLRAAFTQADQILKGKLDKLVVQFEADEPQFFAEYTSARRVGEATTRSAKEKQGTLPLPKAA